MAYKKLRNSTTYAIRKSKAIYNRSPFNENINSPTLFWNQIKKCYPTKEKLMPSKVFDVEGTTSYDENSIARGFCKNNNIFFFSFTYFLFAVASLLHLVCQSLLEIFLIHPLFS